MRKIKEVLRLRGTAQLSHRQIAAAAGISSSTVAEYLLRAKAAGFSWPLPEGLDDAELENLLFPENAPPAIERPLPEFERVHAELRRKGVTLMLLWQEYATSNPDAYSYSRFCKLYNQWRGKLDVVMRQTHGAGERMFVDYAGLVMPLADPITGELTTAQIFVATLGASNYTFAEATHSQSISDWLGSHVRAFAFFGGVPEIVVPDNLKSGVTSPHRYDPEINRSYAELAEHYGIAVIPARSKAPRDKAKVESGVQVVEQSILAVLRDRTFFSLSELNAAIAPLLQNLNDRPFQKLPGSRRSAFVEIDRPKLKELPETAYRFSQWKKARVNIDYHLEVDGHYYSVPYKYIGRQLDVRVGTSTIECMLGSRVIATHLRDPRKGQHTTLSEHMPAAHRSYAEWTPERIIGWAARIGPQSAELAREIIASRAHPEQGYRACLGILRLAKVYGNARLEAASQRALAIGARSYKSIESILKHGLDNQPLVDGARLEDQPRQPQHDNIRGANYYAQPTENTNA
jgi:transposase